MANGNAVVLDDKREVTRLRDLKVSARDQIMLKPTDIEIEDGHNPRNYHLPENRAHLDELKKSIKEVGVLQPLLVRFDPQLKKAVVVDGECRLRACLELITEGHPIEAIPTVQVQGAGNEAERLILALTANTGKPLSKWESGQAFVRLQRFGWEPENISKRLGFSLRFVTEAIELADAPQEVKDLLSQGAITPSLATQQLRTNGAEAVRELKKRAEAAQASGKGTATRERKGTVPNPKIMVRLISQLIASVEDDIFNTEFKFVEVDRATMVRLAALVGITEEKVKGKK